MLAVLLVVLLVSVPVFAFVVVLLCRRQEQYGTQSRSVFAKQAESLLFALAFVAVFLFVVFSCLSRSVQKAVWLFPFEKTKPLVVSVQCVCVRAGKELQSLCPYCLHTGEVFARMLFVCNRNKQHKTQTNTQHTPKFMMFGKSSGAGYGVFACSLCCVLCPLC